MLKEKFDFENITGRHVAPQSHNTQESLMYAFEPRLPVDHVLSAIRLVRTGDFSNGQLLKLIAASVGEVGALLEKGPIFSLEAAELDFDEAVLELESIEFTASSADPNFDPTPWIPVILFIIEWIMKRRQS